MTSKARSNKSVIMFVIPAPASNMLGQASAGIQNQEKSGWIPVHARNDLI